MDVQHIGKFHGRIGAIVRVTQLGHGGKILVHNWVSCEEKHGLTEILTFMLVHRPSHWWASMSPMVGLEFTGG